jgi:hypothetical protein
LASKNSSYFSGKNTTGKSTDEIRNLTFYASKWKIDHVFLGALVQPTYIKTGPNQPTYIKTGPNYKWGKKQKSNYMALPNL